MARHEHNIRSALPKDRSRLANLIHFGSYIHQHLDWKSPLDWIGSQPYLVMERDGNISAALACPPELPEITWIRLFAVSSNVHVDRTWGMLWSDAIKDLETSGYTLVAALSLQGWFNNLLESTGFIHTDNVVVLMSSDMDKLPAPRDDDFHIRPMFPEDMEKVAEIDNSAFDFEWRNSIESLELGYQQSSIASVVESENEIIGYQYSTSGTMGGHLARLAVKKSMQGKGLGYMLVYDLLNQFHRRGVMRVTVNTQEKNTTSIGLYTKAGFKTTGESYRVYHYTLYSEK